MEEGERDGWREERKEGSGKMKGEEDEGTGKKIVPCRDGDGR